MFQVKSFVAIVASMVNRMRSTTKSITDYNVGSVARTMIEAPAQELDEYYQQVLSGLTEAIPVSVYNSFNFGLLGATKAVGPIRVIITASASATTIPVNTVFSLQGSAATYVALSDAVIAAGGTYVDVPVAAAVAGQAGNILAGQVFTPSFTPIGFVSASNLIPFTSGAEQESEGQRKTRFNDYISTLARSPVDGLIYGMKTVGIADAFGNVTERVAFANAVEPYTLDHTQPPALIYGYIHNGVGGTSSRLVSLTQSVIYGYTDATGKKVPGYKAAGVVMVIAAAAETPINLTATMTVAPGYIEADLVSQATQAVYAYILGLDMASGSFILAEVYDLVMSIAGITNFRPVLPVTDIVATGNTKMMPGTISITGV